MSYKYDRIRESGIQYVSELKLPIIPLCSHNHIGVTDSHLEKCKTPGKVPTLYQWSEKTNTTKREIKSWLIDNKYMNLGLILGKTDNHNLIGVDIDGSTGLEYWYELISEHGQHEPTWEFITPGGGTRLIFSAPTNFKSKKFATTLEGEHSEVAFIAQGQQTVLPPSIHANGGTYEWCEDADPITIPKPAPCPQWILDLVSDDGDTKTSKTESKRVSKLTTQISSITKARTNALGAFVGSFTRRNFQVMSLEDCIQSCTNWMYSNIDYGDEEDYFIDQVSSMCHRFYNAEVLRENAKVDKDEEQLILSDASLAEFCILRFADDGYHLRFDRTRNQIAITNNAKGPWIFIYPDELKTNVTRYIQDEYGNKAVKVNKIRNVLELICVFLDNKYQETLFYANVDVFDKHLDSDESIVVENGVLDIKTGELLHWNPNKHFHINEISAKWRKADEHLVYEWETIISKWIPDANTRAFMQEYIGYCLTPSCDFTVWTFLSGGGSNGKSIFIDIVSALFDKSKALVELDMLSERFGSSGIEDKLLYYNTDIEANYISRPGKLKKMIAGEEVIVEKKNKDAFKVRPYGKFLLAANNLPETSDKTDGWLRRMKVVDFPNKFAQDPNFKTNTLRTFTSPKGRTVILSWAVEGLKRLLEQGHFTSSEDMELQKKIYKKQNDNVAAFLDDELQPVYKIEGQPQYQYSISLSKLYAYYDNWCIANGHKQLSKPKFKRRLESCGCEFKKVRAARGSSAISLVGYRINKDTDYYNETGINFDVSFGS